MWLRMREAIPSALVHPFVGEHNAAFGPVASLSAVTEDEVSLKGERSALPDRRFVECCQAEVEGFIWIRLELMAHSNDRIEARNNPPCTIMGF